MTSRNTDPAPCYPEANKTPECDDCARYRPGRELHIDSRQFVVIDASAVRYGPHCPMFARCAD